MLGFTEVAAIGAALGSVEGADGGAVDDKID
jgi:hypothetical protein